MDEIVIKAKPTKKDFLQFTVYVTRELCTKNALNTWLAFIISAIIGIQVFTIIGALPLDVRKTYLLPLGKQPFFFGIFLLYIILGFGIRLFLSKFNFKELVSENGNILKEKLVKISPDGISEENINSYSFTKWQGIMDIQESKTQIMFFVDNHSAYFIPKSAFTYPDDIKEFISKAKDYRNAALNISSSGHSLWSGGNEEKQKSEQTADFIGGNI